VHYEPGIIDVRNFARIFQSDESAEKEKKSDEEKIETRDEKRSECREKADGRAMLSEVICMDKT
jgi:hypothetical protein